MTTIHSNTSHLAHKPLSHNTTSTTETMSDVTTHNHGNVEKQSQLSGIDTPTADTPSLTLSISPLAIAFNKTVDNEEKENNGQPGSIDDAQHEHQKLQQDNKYSEQELKIINELKYREQEVIAHEQAHAAVGGQYTSAPSYEYQTGPDDVKYAVAGKVSIDTSEVSGDPQATLEKAKQIKAAALAPTQPSQQDLKVAAKADRMANEARADILVESTGNVSENTKNNDTESNDYLDHLNKGLDNKQSINGLQGLMEARNIHINHFYQNTSTTSTPENFEIIV